MPMPRERNTPRNDRSERNDKNDRNEAGKVFIGGLSWDTDQDSLLTYFSQFGEVCDCVVMKNPQTGKSRGFGFVTFKDPNCVDTVLSTQHTIDGRQVDAKACNPKGAQKSFQQAQRPNKNLDNHPKIFMGGLPNVDSEYLTNYFSKYGKVLDVNVMVDPVTKKSRGFGFLTFETEDAVDSVCSEHYVVISNKKVECKRAEPRNGKQHQEAITAIQQMITGVGTQPTPEVWQEAATQWTQAQQQAQQQQGPPGGYGPNGGYQSGYQSPPGQGPHGGPPHYGQGYQGYGPQGGWGQQPQGYQGGYQQPYQQGPQGNPYGSWPATAPGPGHAPQGGQPAPGQPGQPPYGGGYGQPPAGAPASQGYSAPGGQAPHPTSPQTGAPPRHYGDYSSPQAGQPAAAPGAPGYSGYGSYGPQTPGADPYSQPQSGAQPQHGGAPGYGHPAGGPAADPGQPKPSDYGGYGSYGGYGDAGGYGAPAQPAPGYAPQGDNPHGGYGGPPGGGYQRSGPPSSGPSYHPYRR